MRLCHECSSPKKGGRKLVCIALSLAAHTAEQLVKASWEVFGCELQSSERFRHLLNASFSSVREPFSPLRSVCPARPIVPSVIFSRDR